MPVYRKEPAICHWWSRRRFGLAERPVTQAFPNAVCRAGASGAALTPRRLLGVCVVPGEKEVKPVGLTVFRNETKSVADFRILHFESFTDSFY